MTGLLANTKIMHKVLAVLLLLGAATVGLAALSASNTHEVNARYAELIKAKQPAIKPDHEALKTSMNQAVHSLRQLLSSVASSVTQIRTGSAEIAQASEDLARRTEGNAASLEETSAAIVQMDGRLKATATAAGETVCRADQAIGADAT